MENNIKILEEKLKEKYLIIPDKIEKNEESTDGNVFIIYSKNNKYVVKIYSNINHVKSMTELYTFLIYSDINVPKIISSKENEKYVKLIDKKNKTENYIIVYSFIEGKQITFNEKINKIDDNIITNIAKVLFKIHNITNYENKFKVPNLPFECKKDYNVNINRYSLLHFDLTKSNIFINNNSTKEKISIIDFDDAKYGPSIYDVAIIIANLFFSKTYGVDIEGTNKFIKEYYSNELELKNKEKPFIKEFALQWIDYILDNNKFDTSTTESFIIKRKLISQKLDIK